MEKEGISSLCYFSLTREAPVLQRGHNMTQTAGGNRTSTLAASRFKTFPFLCHEAGPLFFLLIDKSPVCISQLWAAPGELRGNSPLFLITACAEKNSGFVLMK